MSDHSSARATRVMALVRWALLIAVTALAGASVYRFWGPLPERAGVASDARFYCPMHPQITSPNPGDCPICHMALEPIPSDRSHGAQTVMATDAGRAQDAAALPLATVTLALDRQQLGGVVSEPVRRGGAVGALRAPAVVEASERGRYEVRVRAPGFVERVAVRETGAEVAAGQPLAWVYAPQVFQVQQELLAARRWAGQPGGARSADAYAASRQSLELLGMAPVDIDAMLLVGAPLRAVPVRAPAGATVVRNAAVQGAYATPDAALYELADLSRVWVVASVWERDLARVRRGATARFVPGGGGPAVTARVLLVEPAVAADSRAARVRMEAPNPARALRPGMYGEAYFEGVSDGGVARLELPRDAVIDTGAARYVFVQTGEGTFEPRTVRLGALFEDRWEVLDGVLEGERVVSRGTFMVDSESRLRAALAQRGAP